MKKKRYSEWILSDEAMPRTEAKQSNEPMPLLNCSSVIGDTNDEITDSALFRHKRFSSHFQLASDSTVSKLKNAIIPWWVALRVIQLVRATWSMCPLFHGFGLDILH